MPPPFPNHHHPLSAPVGDCCSPRDFDWTEKNIPCQAACPAQTDIPGYLEAISRGDFAAAFAINLRDNVFPGVLGRVCTRPCEAACRHGWDGLGDSVAICHAKRSACDYRDGQTEVPLQKWYGPTGKRVAVVGAGVAGLTCARNLALLGHNVVVLEAHQRPGGMLVQGIPEFRLPRDVVTQDIARIVALGVVIKCSISVGQDLSIAQLESEYDAVILSTGTPIGNIPDDLEGGDGPGLEHGLAFLRSVNEEDRTSIDGPVVVIGGGFTAIDCARTVLRIGGGNPAVFYRRAVSAIRVTPGEIEEMEQEGLSITGNVRPVSVIREHDRVKALRLIRTRPVAHASEDPRGDIEDIPGSEFEVEARTILLATGQRQDLALAGTERESRFEAGDYATGAGNLIRAIGHAKQVTVAVDYFLMKEKRIQGMVRIEDGRAQPRTRAMDEWRRHAMPTLAPNDRAHQAEVETGLARQDGITEAGRCYLCHYKYEIDISKCIYCDQCVEVKPRPDCIVKITAVNTDANGIITALSKPVPELKAPAEPFFYSIDQTDCIRCNACLEVCPTRCISVQKVSLDSTRFANRPR